MYTCVYICPIFPAPGNIRREAICIRSREKGTYIYVYIYVYLCIRMYINVINVLYFLCPGPWAELIKQDNSAFSMQWCTLNAILPRNFAWLGNNTTHGQMEWFQRNFPNTTLLQTLIHISTLLILQQNYLWAGHLIILLWITTLLEQESKNVRFIAEKLLLPRCK